MPYYSSSVLEGGFAGLSGTLGCGCGTGCNCGSCRAARLGGAYGKTFGEIFESDLNGYGEPAASVSRACPVPSGRTTSERCQQAQPCPAIPGLLCVSSVNGVTFHGFRVQNAGGLRTVAQVNRARDERMKPDLLRCFETFNGLLGRFGMASDQFLSMGSYNCRCTNAGVRLSDHSSGEALDISGLRFTGQAPAGSVGQFVLIHNFASAPHIGLIRRMNALLRLAFPQVLDYHLSDHRDHFHVDLNQGRGFTPRSKSTIRFVQEILNSLGGSLRVSGVLDAATQTALRAAAGLRSEVDLARDTNALTAAERALFQMVASGRRVN
jgi:hypothetical protein